MNGIKFKPLKFALKAVAFLLALLCLLLIIILLPPVQNKIVSIATQKLSEKLETKVSIDRFYLNFIDEVCLEGLYIQDQKGDTLVYTQAMFADIAFWKLFSNTFEMNEFELVKPTVRLNQTDDESFNFDFIVDAFSSTDTTEQQGQAFEINLDLITLVKPDIKVNLIDQEISGIGERIILNVERFDLENSVLSFRQLSLDKLAVGYVYTESQEAQPQVIENYSEFPLDSFPFDISFEEILIKESNILYQEKNATRPISFDPSYVHIQDFSGQLKDLHVTSSSLEAIVAEASANLNDEFQIDQFKTSFQFNNTALSLSSTSFLAGKNAIFADIETRYQEFNDLTNLAPNVNLKMDIQPSETLLRSFGYFVPSIYEDESYKPFISQPLTLQGKIDGTLKRLTVDDLLFDVSQTKLLVDGIVINPMDVDQLQVEEFLLDGTVGYEDYKEFITDAGLRDKMKRVGAVDLDTELAGTMKSLRLKKFELNTESLFELNMQGNLTNVLNTDRLTYQIDITQLTSGRQDAAIFMDSLPAILDDLDTIQYKGMVTGNLTDITMDGDFTTSLGQVSTDLAIAFNQDYSDARYRGEIVTLEFDAGRLLDQDSLGRISMDIRLDGKGLDPDSIKTKVEGRIREVLYNNYNYEQIALNGLVNGQSFKGTASINDPNVKFSFNGSVDLNDSIPQFRFDMNVDTLMLQALNLSTEVFNLSTQIMANFSGNDLDNIVGEFSMQNIHMSSDKKSIKTDSMSLTAEQDLGQRKLEFNSRYGKANIEGDYKIALLDDAVLDFFDRYFPMKTFLGRSPKSDAILSSAELKIARNDVINAKVDIYDIVEIAQFFDIPIEQFDSSTLLFKLEIPADLSELTVYIPQMRYDGYYFDSIYFEGSNQGNQLFSNFKIDSVSVTDAIHSSGIKVDMLFENQSAKIKTLIKNNENIRGLGFSNLVRAGNGDQFNLQFIDQFVLNDKLWNVQQDSTIILSSDTWKIPTISISNNDEKLEIQGSSERLITDFTNFNIRNFVDIIGIDSLDISGIMDGKLGIGLNGDVPLEGDLVIDALRFNEYALGTVDLQAAKNNDIVDMKLDVIGESLDFGGQVKYDLLSEQFQGQLLVQQMELAPYEPLVSSYLTNLSGQLNGDAFIEGTLEKPSVTGVFNLENVSANFVPLTTRYNIQTGTITLFDEVIQPNITLIDEKSRTSYLDGEIEHNYFDDLRFNLTFDADAFTFLDSPADKDALFYGKFVGRVYAEITGDVDLPVVSAEVAALKETDLTVQILANQSTLIEEDYIVFFDSDVVRSPEELDSLSRNAYQTENAVDLNLRLSTTPEALYHVIVDPLTGDRLDIRGEGDLIVLIPNEEDLRIIGELSVVSGNYRLSYENIVRRNFALDPGSRMIFTGDPYAARLDMRALYKTSTNTYALVQGATSTISDGSVSNKTMVEVILYMRGTISNPELNFDIQIPESSTSPVGSNVSTALANIRQSETQLLEQVFSLILFNSFSSGNSSSNFSSVGTSAAVSSVGSLINSQLNRLTKNTNGLELNFALDQYQDQSASSNSDITEVNLGVQQKLFNDRLIVSAGGNANLGISQNTQEFSRIAGDFVVTYLLTKDGRYRVKAFQKSDFDAISTSSVWRTGVGLSYKNKFGKINKSKSVKKAN